MIEICATHGDFQTLGIVMTVHFMVLALIIIFKPTR